MLDTALVDKCADPSLTGAVVEQLIEAAGYEDPLAVTVKSDGRLVLIPKSKTLDEAMQVVCNYVGHAVVRIGLTQYPAGIGMTDVSELKPDLIDSCQNLHIGIAMFAKVIRIVAHWYGNPTDKKVFPHIFDDAIYAWKQETLKVRAYFSHRIPEDPCSGTGTRRRLKMSCRLRPMLPYP